MRLTLFFFVSMNDVSVSYSYIVVKKFPFPPSNMSFHLEAIPESRSEACQ